ncbi:class I SAM-dependent methyltransferase [Phormidium sp. FACHB-1136]|jgi:ubiquinone/menaquinone biosynthesis C-methylase UbiE|uniref:class I SAM-dependent methyltransferase n=1 Tax=Phormidium sp. FACHB-1136 TaxID=2692848 RepID=UPI001689E5B1|nr:class I SAM-dependent methyltransferase [Phormidium sp. FACHB-1136]MBD2425275.1 class I SAM-dependent methyltransferase [Phormidium sp. FACHB-1136]
MNFPRNLLMPSSELRKKLDKIEKVFDADQVLAMDVDQSVIVDYYTQSNPGYSQFHSTDGSVHMALNFDGKFDQQGYYGQAKLVQQQIDQINPTQVLELACGKGFNSVYLATQNPDIEFLGLDLTPVHVEIASQTARDRDLKNLMIQQGDFHHLNYPDHSLDIIFVVESLCHATNTPQVLEESHRVLRPGGMFIVIDGFRKKPSEAITEDEQKAAILVEKAMAVEKGLTLDDFLNLAHQAGFADQDYQDLSDAIMPNLKRLEGLARKFFRFPFLARRTAKLLPPYLVKNTIAGLLMPTTVSNGIHGYFVVNLTKDQ